MPVIFLCRTINSSHLLKIFCNHKLNLPFCTSPTCPDIELGKWRSVVDCPSAVAPILDRNPSSSYWQSIPLSIRCPGRISDALVQARLCRVFGWHRPVLYGDSVDQSNIQQQQIIRLPISPLCANLQRKSVENPQIHKFTQNNLKTHKQYDTRRIARLLCQIEKIANLNAKKKNASSTSYAHCAKIKVI